MATWTSAKSVTSYFRLPCHRTDQAICRYIALPSGLRPEGGTSPLIHTTHPIGTPRMLICLVASHPGEVTVTGVRDGISGKLAAIVRVVTQTIVAAANDIALCANS